ncbi:MAG: glycosyltransferase family 2 protein [Verrucomicrobiia bacterium]|jgi:glycosyltransferase involved in cell wall biosynthesis
MKVSFIVPVYNEVCHVVEVVNRLKALPLRKEIVVVDDGSHDGTTELLKQFKNDPEIVIHLSQLNFGKGTAIRVGLKYATGDIIAIQDGDLEYDARDYLRIVEMFSDPKISVVYGSRFAGKIHAPMMWRYWFGNMLLRFLANLLFRANITDEATAYKAFRREVINSIPLSCKRFEFCPEVTAKLRKRGYVIHEVPISYDPRGLAEGKKIRAKDGWIAIWTLVRLRFVSN